MKLAFEKFSSSGKRMGSARITANFSKVSVRVLFSTEFGIELILEKSLEPQISRKSVPEHCLELNSVLS